MSYTRSFSSSVNYSGTVNYSYPASEHGGSSSVSYSGSIPVTFNIFVDTNNFDSCIDKTNLSLAGVASSVVSMKNAQINAILQSGEKIAKSAINGFYNLISSEMSQQIVENNSKINSSIALLKEQSEQVKHYHVQMEQDFARIKSRYLKIFNELDDECYKRINELDRKSFELSKNAHDDLIVSNYKNAPAVCFLKTLEDANVNLQMSLGRLKNMTNRVIENFLQDVKNKIDFSHNTKKFSFDENIQNQKQFFAPNIVLKCKKIQDSKDQLDTNIEETFYFSPESFSENIKNQIPQKFNFENVSENISNEFINKNSTEKINDFFVKYAENFIEQSNDSEHDKRIYEKILKLWTNQQNIETQQK